MDIREYTSTKIKEYRKLNKMTQKELGEKIGVKHNTISGYESGTAEPEQNLLFKIAKALGVSINDLFPNTVIESAPTLPPEEENLLTDYRKLNNTGKRKAAEYVSDLTDTEKYTVLEQDEAKDVG